MFLTKVTFRDFTIAQAGAAAFAAATGGPIVTTALLLLTYQTAQLALDQLCEYYNNREDTPPGVVYTKIDRPMFGISVMCTVACLGAGVALNVFGVITTIALYSGVIFFTVKDSWYYKTNN